MRFPVAAIALTLLLAPGARGSDPAIDSNDFASGFPVETSLVADVYRIELPLAVYRASGDVRLRDLAVFDRTGQPVPRVLRRPDEESVVSETRDELPAFALPGDAVADPAELHLLFASDPGKTRLELKPAEDPAPTTRSIRGYVVDASVVEHPLTALEFEWSVDSVEGFLGTIEVSASDDLRNWRRVGVAALASLRSDSNAAASVQQRRVELGSTDADYLLVTWRDLPADWRFSTVYGIERKESIESIRNWLVLESSEEDEDGYLYDAAAPLIVDRLQVATAEPNTLIRTVIDARNAPGDPWRRVTEASYYSAAGRDGAATIAERRDRHWRVRLLQGRVNSPPALELGWRPEELVFVAQGEGPWLVAVGRGAEVRDGFPLEAAYGDRSILDLLEPEATASVAGATLGRARPLGGEELRTVPADTVGFAKRGLMWLLLLAGVAVVITMSWRLIRDLKDT